MMAIVDPLPPLTSYRTPAIRHLAWALSAPQLYEGDLTHDWRPVFNRQIAERLHHWDRDSASQPEMLKAIPHQRLGLQFEQLYECLLTKLLNWELLARNLPVRSAGRTLGEFDFLVRNPITFEVEHHEIAVKFYLGHLSGDELSPRWYGPNARDRLDVKINRLLMHQSRLAQIPAAASVLSAINIVEPPRARIFMPGYLFYPCSNDIAAPAYVAKDHLKGYWYRVDQLSDSDFDYCVPLRKPSWLGPWVQTAAPLIADALATAESVRLHNKAQLFARLMFCQSTGIWVEKERFFVVPSGWPTSTIKRS